MDRFSFPLQPAWLRPFTRRCAAVPLAWGWALCSLAGAAHAAPLATHGLVVQLRPGAVAEEVVTAPVVWLETRQAQREQAQAVWQRRHGRQVAHLQALGQAAGVPVKAVGSAGSALRLDVGAMDAAALEATMRRLRLHPDVLSVEPNVRLKRTQAATVPNDPLFSQQWHLQSSAAYAGAINLPAAWSRTVRTQTPVTVAVVDSGVRFDHPDLAGRLWPGYDFVSELAMANDGDGRDADASDPGDWVTAAEAGTALFSGCDVEDSSWHGTAIAGLIAANTNNSVGVASPYAGTQVLPVRVAGKCGAVLSDLLDGLRWAAGLPVDGVPANPHPARIINLSYGGSGACGTSYQTTVNELTAAGALLVVAAGNSGGPLTRPADCEGVVAVTAVRADGAKAGYASHGVAVALAAPGGSGQAGASAAGLLTTLDSGRRGPVGATYVSMTGTSFSAPLVASVAAWVLGARADLTPALTPAELSNLLRSTTRPHTAVPTLPQCQSTASSQGACQCTTQTCGTGLLDADRVMVAAWAFERAAAPAPPAPEPAPAPAAETGGGGALGLLWGAALWVWVVGVGLASRLRLQGQV